MENIPNIPTPPPAQSSKTKLFIALGTILTLGVGAFAYFSNSPDNSKSATPPSIQIAYKKFQGSIGTQPNPVCQIPGPHKYDADAEAKDKNGTPIDLNEGIQGYHSDNNIKVQAILDKIKPVKDNKIFIAYYPSGENKDSIFSVYPSLTGQKKMEVSDEIPANEGFWIFSCMKTTIYGIKGETDYGIALPEILATKTSGWVLMAAPQPEPGKNLKDTFAKNENKSKKDKLQSVWPQKEAGFKFGDTAQTPDTATLTATFKMVWLEMKAAAVEQGKYDPITNLNAELSSDKKSITLTWTAPSTTQVVSYLITSTNTADGKTISEKTVSEKTFKLENVVAGMSYRFAVDTLYPDLKKSGGVSSDIIKVPAGQEIKPVTNLVAALATDNKSINLTWTKPDTTESVKYTVVTYGGPSTPSTANKDTENKFTVTDVVAGKSYYFEVQTTYPNLSISEIVTSDTIKVPGGTIAEGVSNVVATVGANKTSADLTWKAVSKPAGVFYFIYKYDDKGNKIGSEFSANNDTKFNVPGLEDGKSYYFTVVTVYPDSSKSNEVKSETILIKNIPDFIDEESIKLTSAVGDYSDGTKYDYIKLEFKSNPDLTYDLYYPDLDGAYIQIPVNPQVYDKKVYAIINCGGIEGFCIYNMPSGEFNFKIIPIGEDRKQDITHQVITESIKIGEVDLNPTNVTVDTQYYETKKSVGLTWTGKTGAKSYDIYYAKEDLIHKKIPVEGSGVYAEFLDDGTFVNIHNLVPGKYVFRVTGVDIKGQSSFSTAVDTKEINIGQVPPPSAPGASNKLPPMYGFEVGQGSNSTTAALVWSLPTGVSSDQIKHFIVKYWLKDDGIEKAGPSVIQNNTTNSLTINDLIPKNTYTFMLMAVNNNDIDGDPAYRNYLTSIIANLTVTPVSGAKDLVDQKPWYKFKYDITDLDDDITYDLIFNSDNKTVTISDITNQSDNKSSTLDVKYDTPGEYNYYAQLINKSSNTPVSTVNGTVVVP